MSAVAPLLSETELRLVALCCSRRTGREVAAAWATFTSASVSNGTLYTTLTRLAEAGLVTKTEVADQRARCFVATKAGRDALARTRRHHEALARFAQVPA